MKREHVDFVIDGYVRSLLHTVQSLWSKDVSPDGPKVGDIALGTLKQARSDVMSFVRQTSDVTDELIQGWSRDSHTLRILDHPWMNESASGGYFIRKLHMLGERFFHTRIETLLIPSWRWFKPPDWGNAEMAATLHGVARSFPKVTFYVDRDGQVRQR